MVGVHVGEEVYVFGEGALLGLAEVIHDDVCVVYQDHFGI